MNAPTTPSLAITWQQPTFLLPLFCLCPLLAAANSLAMALGLSIVLCIATVSTMVLTFLIRPLIPNTLQTFAWLMISSAVIAILELLLHAWNYPLFRGLGLFLPLCVVACLLITRPQMQLEQSSLSTLAWRALKMNGGFTFAALILGTARELIGHGTLFYDAVAIFGNSWQSLSLTLFRSDMGFLLAVLAPGAFIGFGIGVAIYNWLWIHLPLKNHDNA